MRPNWCTWLLQQQPLMTGPVVSSSPGEIPTNCKGEPLEIGKGRVVREGNKVAILGFGTIVQNCVAAGHVLQQEFGISITIADARFCKPLDQQLIRQLANEHEILITVQERSVGGFSSHVSHFLTLNGLLDGKLKDFS